VPITEFSAKSSARVHRSMTRTTRFFQTWAGVNSTRYVARRPIPDARCNPEIPVPATQFVFPEETVSAAANKSTHANLVPTIAAHVDALRNDLISFSCKNWCSSPACRPRAEAQQFFADTPLLGLAVDVVSSELDDLKHHRHSLMMAFPSATPECCRTLARRRAYLDPPAPRSHDLTGTWTLSLPVRESLGRDRLGAARIRERQLYGRASCSWPAGWGAAPVFCRKEMRSFRRASTCAAIVGTRLGMGGLVCGALTVSSGNTNWRMPAQESRDCSAASGMAGAHGIEWNDSRPGLKSVVVLVIDR